jgi:AraC-like DNA-binding protein
MKPVFYPVHPALRPFINSVMVFDIQFGTGDAGRYAPFPPTPQHNINFYPADAMQSRKQGDEFAQAPAALLIGPQTSRVDLMMGKHHIIVSVAFGPGGLFRLLKVPMNELMDQPFDARDFLGREIDEVNEQLREAPTAIAMKNIVEAYLLRKLRGAQPSPFERTMKQMLHHAITIDNAASASCLSLRQFERRSIQLLGYSPKFFARLIRFSKAYRLKINAPGLEWSQIAYQAGYYDQMHLIKDFKVFAGANPGELGREILRSPVQVQREIGL